MSRKVSEFGCGWVALLVLASCERTFITNNYLASTEDARASGGQDAQAAVTEAGTPDSDGATVITIDAALSVEDAGKDAGPSVTVDAASLDAGGDTPNSGDAGERPLAEGVPVVNAALEAQTVDVFGTFNNHYWFVATPGQVDAINTEYQNGGGGWWGGFNGGNGDIYAPNSGQDALNAVEHLVVTTPDGKTADYGVMKVKLVGQSTGRPWTDSTLPNFKLDTDDVTAGMRIGGYEHFRLNNAVIGTIFREKFVYDLYNALGYPAPRSSYAWVSTTMWEPDAKVPYIVTESYKRGFCRNREDQFGGECPNMWEFASDLGYGMFEAEENCQFDRCDASRATLFESAVTDAYNGGATTVADLGEYVDWNKFHQFQCLSWIFGTTDAPPLTTNNTVWAERADGKFQMLPYSIDISLSLGSGGQWYDPGLYGSTQVAQLCQSDEQCWADTIAVCEGMITSFVALDPVGRMDQLYTDLQTAGMLRSGDDARYRELRSVLGNIVTQLPTALDAYRAVRHYDDQCQYDGMVNCGGYCEYVEDCYLCDDDYYANPDYTGPGGSSTYPVVTGSGAPVPLPPPEATAAAAATATATAPPSPDGGVIGPDGSGVPLKPDFCYSYEYARIQEEQKLKAAYVHP